MKFTKMQGIGNDYVYVNCFEEKVADPANTARIVSDRHFGIGSDGLILIKPSDTADVEMDMYNLDGSRGAMCGNGIRCVAKYAYDHGLVGKETFDIATGSGIKTVKLTVRDGKAELVRVDMGSPCLDPVRIPVDPSCFKASPVIDCPLTAAGRQWKITAVSMGNPHAVIFTENIDDLDLPVIGPSFENHPAFPDRVNTEFVEKIDEHTVKMRVWERGSGETMACGTGACAVAVASILNGVTDGTQPVTVQLRGGSLIIEWDREKDTVFMTGPAAEVFHGEIDL